MRTGSCSSTGGRGRCSRVDVHRLAEARTRLTWTFHHAIADGWSNARFATELFEQYHAVRNNGLPMLLPSLEGSQHGAVRAELEALASDEPRAYFRAHLQGMKSEAALERQSSNGVETTEALEVELVAALRERAAQLGVPLRSLLLAVHLRALGLVTQSRDCICGVVHTTRPQGADADQVLGLFLNVLPLRVNAETESWGDWVRRVFDAELAQLPHRAFPLAELQRANGGEPLFEATFNFTDFHVYEAALAIDADMLLSSESVERHTLPLSVLFTRDVASDTLHLRLESNAHYTDPELIAMSRAWIGLLREVAVNSEANAPLAEMDSVAQPQQQRTDATALRARLVDTRPGYDLATPVPVLVRRAIESTPDGVALQLDSGSMTYAELGVASRNFAAQLRKRGIGPGTAVGLCIERSFEWVIAALGIWEVGAHYVALDPEGPPARVAVCCRRCDVSWAVASREAQAMLEDVADSVTILRVGDSREAGTDAPDAATRDQARAAEAPESSGLLADALAYVIFTSGSTGTPKPVGVSHRALVNHLLWRQEAFPMDASDAFLHLASSTFDISVWEVFAPLLAGARLVLARPGGHQDPRYLCRRIAEERVTQTHFHPALIEQALAFDCLRECVSLRVLFSGGEKLSPRTAAAVGETLTADLVHQYGPTEATIDVTTWTVRPSSHGEIPIGYPTANTYFCVADRALEPVRPRQRRGAAHRR